MRATASNHPQAIGVPAWSFLAMQIGITAARAGSGNSDRSNVEPGQASDLECVRQLRTTPRRSAYLPGRFWRCKLGLPPLGQVRVIQIGVAWSRGKHPIWNACDSFEPPPGDRRTCLVVSGDANWDYRRSGRFG